MSGRKGKLLVAALGLGVVATLTYGVFTVAARDRARELAEREPAILLGQTVRRIEVLDESRPARTYSTTAWREISELVDLLALVPKGPCKCAHERFITFTTEEGRIEADFCGHCFDVGKQSYEMPPKFYQRICKLLDARED